MSWSLAVLALGVLGLAVLIGAGRSLPRAAAGLDALVGVGGVQPGRALAPGFVGLSFEYPALVAYAGSEPDLNPVLERLVANLAPGQAPVLRIGGDSADFTWWPVAGEPRPPGITYSLSASWLSSARGLATATGARLILDVGLKDNSPTLEAAQARALLGGVGPAQVQALELGNEPEFYGSFPAFYHAPGGRAVYARPAGYGPLGYREDFSRLSGVLPRFPLAGPAVGAPAALAHLGSFLASEPGLGLVTFHRYPLNRCFTSPGQSDYPTIPNLLSRAASTGLMQGVGGYAAIAHARGAGFRVDEMNSVACGGKRGISDTFATALWAMDALFASARAGVDGVNFHTFPGARYGLFAFHRAGGRWWGSVAPEYYGLLMFAKAAPPGSRLLATGGQDAGPLRSWATLAPDGRTRVLLINDSPTSARDVQVRPPGAATGAASLERLTAPSLTATTGVTLAGQSFQAQTDTGQLTGPRQDATVPKTAGHYRVSIPPASAALLTTPRG